MLNRIWGGIFLIAILAGAVSSATQGGSIINAMAASLFESAKLGVEISIGLIGALALWLGLFEIAQAAGIVAFLARKSTPFLHRLMPGVPKDHPAFGSISMNVAMGMLGIDNGHLRAALLPKEVTQWGAHCGRRHCQNWRTFKAGPAALQGHV